MCEANQVYTIAGKLEMNGGKLMAEAKMAHNSDCENPQHDKHLCFLMYEGFHFSNREAYKALVQDAQFRCQQCGRTAKDSASLCMPEAL